MQIPQFDGEAQVAVDAFDAEYSKWRVLPGPEYVNLERNNGDGSVTRYRALNSDTARMAVQQASMRAALNKVAKDNG